FVDSQGAHDNVFVGYLGTQDAFVESAFSGTLVAPNAKLWLKTTGTPHRGSFFAKHVDVAAEAVVEHHPFPLAWTYGNQLVLGARLSTATVTQVQAATGCGCSVPTRGRLAGWGTLLLGLGLLYSRRRRVRGVW